MLNIDNFNFNGKRAIVRVDFNVPLNNQLEVTDDTRIRAAMPTVKKIIADGGRAILMSHLGRPKNGPEDKFSLKHIIPTLEKNLGTSVIFADDCIGQSAIDASAALENGQVLLLENLRFYGEEKKGDEAFSQKLAALADVYVNDAFGTAHRAHASTTVIAQFMPQKMFGYLMKNEVESIDAVLKNSKKPFTAIMGGAKVSSKITIIEHLLDKVDNLILGGGMTYTFIKAQGGQVGSSLVEDDYLEMALDLIEKARDKNVNLLLPIDSINADKFANDANKTLSAVSAIPEGLMGLDIGERTIKEYSEVIENSKTILWNGPMGVFEMPQFENGTKQIGDAIVKATANGAFSLVGGGDSVAAVNKYNMADKVSYVSTGGGALMEYMEGKELPGIAAIRS